MKVTSYPSPNFDERPKGVLIDTAVIHYTDMETAKLALERLSDSKAKVSAHYLVDVDGTIYQLVPDEKRAWHAGLSCWRGRENVNHFSIGIELQNPGHVHFLQHCCWSPYPLPQMEALVVLLTDLTGRHPIQPCDIVGHSDIAPARKQDPGPHFDWKWLAERGFGKNLNK
jgi:N-acetylmuramoyl-L-alanine amidase